MAEDKDTVKENFNDSIAIRIDKDVKDNFKTKSDNLSKKYQVMLREIIEAFNDDRLKIIPTDEQKEGLKNLYQE